MKGKKGLYLSYVEYLQMKWKKSNYGQRKMGKQISGYQRWGLVVGEVGEGGQKTQISSCEINKSWGSNVWQ